MYEDQTLATRIDRLEKKIDRLFSDLFRFLSEYVAGDQALAQQRAALAAPTNVPSTAEQANRPYSPEGTGVKVLRVSVNDEGQFEYDPPRWDYRIGTRLQWVSKSGNFTIMPKPQEGYEGLDSPFDRRDAVSAKFDHEDGEWKSDIIPVNSVFSEAERIGRQLSGAPWAYYNYVVAVEKNGEIMVDASRNGTGC